MIVHTKNGHADNEKEWDSCDDDDNDNYDKVLIMRAVVGWKSVFYQITKHGAEVKLSRHLPICTMSD